MTNRSRVSLPVVLLLLGFKRFECFVPSRTIRPSAPLPSSVVEKGSPLCTNRRGYIDKNCFQLVPDTLEIVAGSPMSLGATVAGSGGSLVRAIQLGGIPAIGMLVATWAGLQVHTPPTVVGALQHFAAGILLTTVAKELLPEMVQAEGLVENLASAFGFFAGVGVLILLGILLPEEEDFPEEENMKELRESSSLSNKPTPSLRNRRSSKKREAFMATSMPFKSVTNREMDVLGDELRSGWENADLGFNSSTATALSTDSGRTHTPTDRPNEGLKLTLPTALLAAVCIDSALDGLLVGTSTALDPSTSNILSASLTVESSFLGLTIATAIRNCRAPKKIKLLGTTLAPTSLVLGSSLGGSLAPIMAESPALLAGFLGFGTSATLFMVAEELLLQAHEDGAEHVWWVDLQLYVGFYASVMLEKALDLL